MLKATHFFLQLPGPVGKQGESYAEILSGKLAEMWNYINRKGIEFKSRQMAGRAIHSEIQKAIKQNMSPKLRNTTPIFLRATTCQFDLDQYKLWCLNLISNKAN